VLVTDNFVGEVNQTVCLSMLLSIFVCDKKNHVVITSDAA